MRGGFRNIRIRQHYKYDCGAACIASVAAFYGMKVSLAQIRLHCGCSPDGISIQGLVEGAAKAGLLAKGYKSPDKRVEDIENISSPIIALVLDDENFYHYITIYRTGRRRVKIMDPAEGAIKWIRRERFLEIWSGYVVIALPQGDIGKPEGNLPSLACLSDLILSNYKEIALSFAGSIACSGAGISTSLLLQHLIDKSIPEGETSGIMALSALLFAIMVFSLYVSYCATRYLIRSSIKIDTVLVTKYLEKLFRLPLSFFGNYRAGDIASRMEDINNVRSFVTGGIIGILSSAITVAGALCVMYIYNTRLTLYILLFIPIYIALYMVSGYINKRYSRELASLQASFHSSLLECINGITNVRHYDSYPLSIGRVEEDYVSYAGKLNSSGNIVNMFETSVQGVSKMLIFLIITIGSISLLKGEMSIGELVGFYSLCSFFTIPLNELIATSEMISRTTVSVERIFEILNLQDEDDGEKIPLQNIDGEICLKGVDFKFPGRGPLVENLTFNMAKGEITALKGESGSGKSTIAQLILRDYPIDGGSITFGGIETSHFGIREWRGKFGYVPQQGVLFKASILDNITLRDGAPSVEKIMEILGDLGMIGMVERLPKGLLTQVGEGGNELSGGERQKVCIARAIYKNPDIYIFDEVTSSLDRESEKHVLECIQKLKGKGKTILLISHKERSLDIADNVVNIN